MAYDPVRDEILVPNFLAFAILTFKGDADGDVVVMEASKEKKLIAEMNMGSSVYSTAVPANGTLFLTTRNQLFALAQKP